MYYFAGVAIGSEEVLLVEMRFRSAEEARLATQIFYNQDLSLLVMYLAQRVDQPRKIKVRSVFHYYNLNLTTSTKIRIFNVTGEVMYIRILKTKKVGMK